MTEPVALAIHKHDRWCVIGKITVFEGDTTPILAVAWRSQAGTKAAISLPQEVLDYARRQGVRWFYLRNDRQHKMWSCPLATFYRGRLHPDGELYIPLTWLEEVPWQDWAYAERVVRLEHTGARGAQMPLCEVA